MFTKIVSRFVWRTTGTVAHELEEIAKIAGLWVLAVVLLVASGGFLTWLVYDELDEIYGPKMTLAAIAVVYALAGFALINRAKFLATHGHGGAKPTDEMAQDAPDPDPDKLAATAHTQDTVDNLVELLNSAGMRKEALGLLAAKGALGDVQPVQLFMLSIVAGFIVGRGK